MVAGVHRKMKLRILLVCLLSLSPAACKRKAALTSAPPAVSSTMDVDEQKSLNASLVELEAVLVAKAPFIHKKLAPLATNSQLTELRAGLGGARVQSLELWYQWHNGCSGRITNVLPLGRMLSISESLQDRNMIQNVPFVDQKRRNALKILDDGAGDGFFVDVASPSPRVFYHMLEDPFPRDYGTLPEFVQFIVQVHAAGLASLNNHGMVNFDMAGYAKLETKHFAKLRDKS